MNVRAVDEFVHGNDESLSRHWSRVGKPLGLGDEVDDVHAETVDAAVKPPNHHVPHGFTYLGMLPVQIWLFAVEEVHCDRAGARAAPAARRPAGDPGRQRAAGPRRPRRRARPRLRLAARLRRATSSPASTRGWRRPSSASTAPSPTAALVRYDAYNEMSGRQSTSIALLDATRLGRRPLLDPPPRPGAAVRQAGRGRARASSSSRPRRRRRCAPRSPARRPTRASAAARR